MCAPSEATILSVTTIRSPKPTMFEFEYRQTPMPPDAVRDEQRRLVEVRQQADDVTNALLRRPAIGTSARHEHESARASSPDHGSRADAATERGGDHRVDRAVIPGLRALREMAAALETLHRGAVLGGADQSTDYQRTAHISAQSLDRAALLLRNPALRNHAHAGQTVPVLQQLSTQLRVMSAHRLTELAQTDEAAALAEPVVVAACLVESQREPEPLDALLRYVRATNSTDLAMTETALSRAALRTLQIDQNYEMPINQRSRCARGADLAALATEVHELRRLAGTGRASIEAVERRQDWSRYAISSANPISTEGTDDDHIAAVRRNAALGLPESVGQALWRLVVPSETHRRIFFTREFTDALFAQHIGDNGVLNEAALQQCNVASILLRERNVLAQYRRSAWWQHLNDAEFAQQAAAVTARFEFPSSAFERAPGRGLRRRITLDPRLVEAITNWQAWHRREAAVSWGLLAQRDLELLGIMLPAATAETPTVAAAASEVAEESAADQRGVAAELRSGIHDRISTLAGAHRADDRAHAHATGRHSRRRPPRSRHPATDVVPAPSATIENTAAAANAQLESYLVATVRPTMAAVPGWSPAQSVRRSDEPTIAWAMRIVAALTEVVGDHAHTADAAAAATLREMGLVLGTGPLIREGWDARLTGSGPTGAGHAEREAARAAIAAGLPAPPLATVEERAATIEPQLQSFREKLQHLLTLIGPPLSSRPPQPSVAFAAIRTASAAGDLVPPPLVRHRWRATWPTLPAQDGTLAQARAWLAALRTALGTTTREIAITQSYAEHIVNTNPDAVMVDLNLTGIEITNNNGNALPRSDMHLDPVFALQMARFLGWLSGQGVVRMWTSGFLRNAMSAQDTHPMGMACDVTGFTFAENNTVIHLRSGLPARVRAEPLPTSPAPLHRRDDADSSQRDTTEHAGGDDGHSDWFDHSSMLNGRSHAHILMGIAAQMTHYFDRIVGPGHNPEHMNHFHVETSPGGARADGLRLLAMSSESTHLSETARHAADARNNAWDTQVEPLPLLPPHTAAVTTPDSDD